ncbi:GNAT family N-acetyltransferase [Kineosporia sp. J2-2]|uniref:GNAT family N-acetyltransferase n=1 Tax=Kineosporia corallincola TaxID=2835133 RepID=A0ABS5THA0_9ACTN|nr:GNAT family N-acetyltransferase [Kineosporia corallincola]MBT0769423.1 GNAT family N-acetyltransferase [Kineosporia corallincola]
MTEPPPPDDDTVHTISVTPATPADLPAIWPLASALATSYVPRRAAFAESYGEIITDPRQALLLARSADGERVLGYVHVLAHHAFHANGLIAWVEELIVDESARGHGLGAGLMRAAQDWARAAGCAYLSLATRRAAGFYRHLDYEDSAVYFKKELGRASS